jgi:hypothetical protein
MDQYTSMWDLSLNFLFFVQKFSFFLCKKFSSELWSDTDTFVCAMADDFTTAPQKTMIQWFKKIRAFCFECASIDVSRWGHNNYVNSDAIILSTHVIFDENEKSATISIVLWEISSITWRKFLWQWSNISVMEKQTDKGWPVRNVHVRKDR